ncbi:unnamed protein product [Amoebophrya sp. A120]|nr:unnamed protein product [Amoebophrya sp. A120]|eukprot:GSA120T00017013001.1
MEHHLREVAMRSNTRSFSAVAGKRAWSDPQTHWAAATKRPTTPSYRTARMGGYNTNHDGTARPGTSHGTGTAHQNATHHGGYTTTTSGGHSNPTGLPSGRASSSGANHAGAGSHAGAAGAAAAHQTNDKIANHRVLHLLSKRPHSAFNTNRKRAVRPVAVGGETTAHGGHHHGAQHHERKVRERPKSGDNYHHRTFHHAMNATVPADATYAMNQGAGATGVTGTAALNNNTDNVISTAMDYRRYMDERRRIQAEKRHRLNNLHQTEHFHAAGAGAAVAKMNHMNHTAGGETSFGGATASSRPGTAGASGNATASSASKTAAFQQQRANSSSATEEDVDGVSTRSGTVHMGKTASTSLASLTNLRDQISNSNQNALSTSLKHQNVVLGGTATADAASRPNTAGGAGGSTPTGSGATGTTALPFTTNLASSSSSSMNQAGSRTGTGLVDNAAMDHQNKSSGNGAQQTTTAQQATDSTGSVPPLGSGGQGAGAQSKQTRQYGEPITLRAPTGTSGGGPAQLDTGMAARPTTAPSGATKPGKQADAQAAEQQQNRQHESWHQDDEQGTFGGALANINTSTTIHDYIIGKQIGQGAYATVRLAVHKPSGKKVAIKIYEKSRLLDPQRRKSVRREIRVMDRLSHPNIVKFYEVADTSRQVFLVLEYINGGSLHYLLKKRTNRRLSEIDARMIFSQVCAGIRYCHERLVVHRDIKLENVLVQYPDKAVAHNIVRKNPPSPYRKDQNLALTSSGHLDPRQLVVKLIDFGFASLVVPGKKLRVFCGTPSYMAPEIIQRREYGGYCVDIWALGILLYAMLFGQFPFRGQSDKELYKKILKGAFVFPEGLEQEVSKNARALLAKVFVNMEVRPTIQNVSMDPFFSEHLSSRPGTANHHRPSSSHATLSGQRDLNFQHHHEATTRPATSSGTSSSAGAGGNVNINIHKTASGYPLREEAIAKLEKLGYAREDILRQMKDENSHLSKLYTRFVKALNAWGK